MITRKGLHLAHLKLELESTEHVLSVLKHQQPIRKKQEKIDAVIAEYEAIRDKLVDAIFEEEILIGDNHG